MTVESTTSRAQYDTNGTTGPWTVDFYFLANAHLRVVYTTAAGVETLLELGVDYTVSGAGDEDGGSVSTAASYPAGGHITILRRVPRTQETDYTDQDAFPADSHERALDKLTMIDQEMTEELTRALQFSAGDLPSQMGSLPVAASRLDRMLAFDEVTGAPVMSDFTHTRAASAIASVYAGSAGPLDALTFLQAGADAVPISAQDKMRETVSIQGHGGLDDYDGVTPITNSLPALSKIIADFPTGARIRLPKTRTGRYYMAGNAAYGDLSNFEIDPDPGVSVHYVGGGFPLLSSSLRKTRPLAIKMATQGYTWSLSPRGRGPVQQKPHQLSPADGDAPQVDKVSPLASLLYSTVDPSTGSLSSTTASADAETAAIASVSTTGFTVGTMAIRPGQEVHAQATIPGLSGSLCAFVQTESGWVMFSQPNAGGNMTRRIAVSGFAVQTVSYAYPLDIQPYWLVNAEIGIKVHSPRSFSVLVNHCEVARVDNLTSNIVRAGWGAGMLAVSGTAYITTPVKLRYKRTGGRPPIAVVVAGDSLADNANANTWVPHFERSIAGLAGVQVSTVLNLAVSGHTSVQQRDIFVAQNLSGYSYALIAVGPNDIGGGSTPDQFVTAITDMVNHCRTYNVTPLVGLPSMFYLQADAAPYGQTGQATANANNGAPYRLKLLRALADLQVQVNIMQMEDMGAVLPSLLALPGVDPIVQDNIHPTGYGAEMIGLSWAKAVAGHIVPAPRKDLDLATAPVEWIPAAIRPNYGVITRPSYRVLGDDFIMSGFMDTPAPVPTGLEVLTIPAAYAPASDLVVTMACGDVGATPNRMCNVQISSTGSVRVHNVPADVRYLFFGTVQYPIPA